MSARVRSPRGIKWYRPRSVRMPVVPSSQQFGRTYPGNSRTKIYIAIQPVVGQHRDRVRWNQPVEGNRMVSVAKRPLGYPGQQGENGKYLRGQMCATVRKDLIGVHSPRGIEWYRSLNVRMPVVPSSQQFDSTCPGNQSTKVWITLQPVVREFQDRVR